MRRNLYRYDLTTFLVAVTNEGFHRVTSWQFPKGELHYRKGLFHLIVKKGSHGDYYLLHRDVVKYGGHRHTVAKEDALEQLFARLQANYKVLRGR